MTLEREPASIEDALFSVLGKLTVPVAAEVTGRSQDYLRALSHPTRRERLTLEDAKKLDVAYHARTGDGFPLYQAYGREMDLVAAERFADVAAIGRIAVKVAKEHGEATAAIVEASLPGASPRKLDDAIRQLAEADEAGHSAIALLRDVRARPPDPPTSLPP